MRHLRLFVFAAILLSSTVANAQKSSKYDEIPGLTAQQREKILALKKEYDAREEVFKNKKKELEKQIKKLKTSFPVDMLALEKAIEEHCKQDAGKEIEEARGEQQIRKVLNEKQREYYDNNILYKNKKNKK